MLNTDFNRGEELYRAPYPKALNNQLAEEQSVEQQDDKVIGCSRSLLSSLNKSFSELGDYIVSQINTNILYPVVDGSKWEKRREEIQKNLNGERINNVISLEGDRLDGMFFPAIAEKDNPLAKKAIVFVPGADGYYEDEFTYYFVSFVKEKLGDINIVVFNYPSVLVSEGNLNPDSMAMTVYTACSYLKDKVGIPLDDMLVYGQSLGGVATIRGSKLVQEQYPEAQFKIATERSFCNLPDVVEELCGGGKIGSAMKSLTAAGDWTTTDVIEDFNALKGNKLVIYSDYDGMVRKVVSLYQALQASEGHGNVRVLSMEGEKVSTGEHWRKFTSSEEAALVGEFLHLFGLVPIEECESPLVRTMSVAEEIS